VVPARWGVKVALYARVSTDRQDPEVQLLVLRSHAANRGWEIVEEFVDKGLSGAKERRPALGRLMKVAWAGRFQAVLVWRFDRFARSVKHLISALETFRNLNVGFISLQEQFDTSTLIGQAMFTIIGAMAQLERDIIRERVKAGLDRAQARGIRLGRPAADAEASQVIALKRQGLSLQQISSRLHCSRSTVRRRLLEVDEGISAQTATILFSTEQKSHDR
jgi:DNA invertase Pin-like site-specific DNA recombinase